MFTKRWYLYIDYKKAVNYSIPISLPDLRDTVRSLREKEENYGKIKWTGNKFLPLLKEHAFEKIVEEIDVVQKIQIDTSRGERFISCPISEK